MTVTWVTSLAPPSRQAPLVFTTDAAAANVSMTVYFPKFATDETVVWAGQFTARYSESTVVDLGATRQFTVVRASDWPASEVQSRILEGLVPHASTHILGGADQVSGELLSITRGASPTGYTAALDGLATTSVGQLGSHIKGIDTALASNTASIASNTASIATKAAASVAYNFPILTISIATTVVGSTHRGNKIRSTGASNGACVFTVQSDANDATFGIGDFFVIRWSGVGQPSVAAGSGATINDNSKLKIASAGDEITVQKVAANTYEIGGARAS